MYRLFLTISLILIVSCSLTESEQIYIPTDLDDAHAQLLKILPANDIARIGAMTSENDMAEYHFGLGMDLRNRWRLWGDSRLAAYFKQLGIDSPDDMSSIILATFWCKLHDKPFELEQRIAYFHEYWLSIAQPKETSPRDGAKIAWVIRNGDGKQAVHLGISISDYSYWRFAYAAKAGIEPATQEESIQLNELRGTWQSQGAKIEDFIRN